MNPTTAHRAPRAPVTVECRAVVHHLEDQPPCTPTEYTRLLVGAEAAPPGWQEHGVVAVNVTAEQMETARAAWEALLAGRQHHLAALEKANAGLVEALAVYNGATEWLRAAYVRGSATMTAQERAALAAEEYTRAARCAQRTAERDAAMGPRDYVLLPKPNHRRSTALAPGAHDPSGWVVHLAACGRVQERLAAQPQSVSDDLPDAQVPTRLRAAVAAQRFLEGAGLCGLCRAGEQLVRHRVHGAEVARVREQRESAPLNLPPADLRQLVADMGLPWAAPGRAGFTVSGRAVLPQAAAHERVLVWTDGRSPDMGHVPRDYRPQLEAALARRARTWTWRWERGYLAVRMLTKAEKRALREQGEQVASRG